MLEVWILTSIWVSWLGAFEFWSADDLFSNVYCLWFLVFLGATSAKLVAHKSKGMPLISIPLGRLKNSSADDAKSNLSFELFNAYKGQRDDIVRGSNILYLNTFILFL